MLYSLVSFAGILACIAAGYMYGYDRGYDKAIKDVNEIIIPTKKEHENVASNTVSGDLHPGLPVDNHSS